MSKYKHTMVDTGREDPLLGFHFKVEVMGKLVGYFMEVSGLGSETEIVEHKVVNSKGVEVVLKVPGRLKWNDIELKRGITSEMDMWTWRKEVEDGDVKGARMDGSIVMFDQALTAVARWNFFSAWPSKVDGPSLKSDDNSVAVESITLVHEGITRVK